MSTDASVPEVRGMTFEHGRVSRTLVMTCAASLLLHGFVLASLSLFNFIQKTEVFATISSVVEQGDLEDFVPQSFDTRISEQIGTETLFTNTDPSQAASAVFSKDAGIEIDRKVDAHFDVPVRVSDGLPALSKTNLLATVATSGATEHAGGVEGAVDRLAWEIANSLRERKTLVVWLFDVSPSLSKRRAKIADRVDNVYKQLTQLNVATDQVLKSAVAVFGEKCKIVTDKPVDDSEQLIKAVRNIQSESDSSGLEYTFAAVNKVARHFLSARTEQHRDVMIIIVTDEAGSDPAMQDSGNATRLDQAIGLCRKYGIRCYCVGDSAPFGRETVEAPFQMDNGETVIGVMHKGPESFYPELVRLGYWGTNSYDLDEMSSGFGPYALTRLCSETNGLYLISDEGRGKHHFDPAVMRNYTPDYRPITVIEREMRQNRAKAALVETCVQVSNEAQAQKVLNIPMPRLDFRSDNDTVLRQELTEAQRPVAVLDASLEVILTTLERGEKDRAKVKEARWRASYDLAVGRTLALRTRARGYNAVLAEMKQNPKPFEVPRNNKWTLVPSKDMSTADVVTKKLAARALEYLNRVIEEHPGTPWQLLAERERGVPMGWEWKESHYNPNPVVAAAARNQKAGPKFIDVDNSRPRKQEKPTANTGPIRREI